MTIRGQDSPGLMRPLGEATMGLEHRGMEITGGHSDLEKLMHSFPGPSGLLSLQIVSSWKRRLALTDFPVPEPQVPWVGTRRACPLTYLLTAFLVC